MGWPLSHPDPKPWWPAHMLGGKVLQQGTMCTELWSPGAPLGPRLQEDTLQAPHLQAGCRAPGKETLGVAVSPVSQSQ